MKRTKAIVYRLLWPRKLKDQCVRLISYLALLLAIGALLWILLTVCHRGLRAINWTFLTEGSKPFGSAPSGIANALLGTLEITGVATLLSVGPALLAGIGLAQYGRGRRWGDLVRFSANVMMGLPSIIVGLMVYLSVVVTTGHFSGFAGSIALALIMFPVIMRTTEEMLLLLPESLEEAALSLGMTRMRAILFILCRAARPGLLTGILLSIARVGGETAPLLFTALYSDAWPTSFFSEPTANIPVLMTEYATNSPFEQMHTVAWGAAGVIMGVILCVNIVIRTLFKDKYHG